MINIMENKQHSLLCALIEAGDIDALRAFNVIRTKWWTQNRPWEVVAPGEIEQDEFDPTAKVIVLILNGMVIGGCRLISPDENGFLPFLENADETSEYVDVTKDSLEISRWCIAKENIPPRVYYSAQKLMITGAAKYLYDNGLESVYMDVCEFLFHMVTCETKGRNKLVKLDTCGELHEYQSFRFQPAALDMKQTAVLLGLVEADKVSKIAQRA